MKLGLLRPEYTGGLNNKRGRKIHWGIVNGGKGERIGGGWNKRGKRLLVYFDPNEINVSKFTYNQSQKIWD